jgi:hypothetical protein
MEQVYSVLNEEVARGSRDKINLTMRWAQPCLTMCKQVLDGCLGKGLRSGVGSCAPPECNRKSQPWVGQAQACLLRATLQNEAGHSYTAHCYFHLVLDSSTHRRAFMPSQFRPRRP